MQEYTRKRTDQELQLWEINTPRQKQVQTGRKQVSGQNTQTVRRNISAQYQVRNTSSHRSARAVKRRRDRIRLVLFYRFLALGILVLFLVGIFRLTGAIYKSIHARHKAVEASVDLLDEEQDGPKTRNPIEKPKIIVNLLEQNPYSRPGTKLTKVKTIFVHYTANQGTSAEQNRSYFANLAETGERSASAHFIIGYEGEILQCIPLEEEAFAVVGRNNDSISIECCYLSEDGSFTQSTYNSLIQLLGWLCGEYELSEQDILRHYDEGRKKCPLYYVEHEDEWRKLLEDVKQMFEDANSSP